MSSKLFSIALHDAPMNQTIRASKIFILCRSGFVVGIATTDPGVQKKDDAKGMAGMGGLIGKWPL